MSGQAIVTIRDKQWTCSVASTYEELTTGLSGVPSMPAGTGMLFILPQQQIVTVTAEGMFFPLSVIFIDNNLLVTEVARLLTPGDEGTTSLPCRYFLEVNVGEADSIQPGDVVSLQITQAPGISSWITPVVTFAGLAITGVFMAKMSKIMADAVLGKPKEKPALLPKTEERFKSGEIVLYKGERVRVSEQIGDRVNIFIPSRQELVWVKPDKLEKTEKGYYWTAFNKNTGEIAEPGKTYATADEAMAAGKQWASGHWKDMKSLVEVWRHPHPYFEKLKVKPVMSEIIGGKQYTLARQILEGLSGKDKYQAYVKYPKDRSAFVTIGAIVGGHYSWNPAGFTVWVDAWERNPEWPPDHILAIKELRRPHTFEASEEGVRKALEYVETEFPTFTETMWVSKSIPIYVAHELGIMKKEAAPEWLPDVVMMPKLPEEARKDILFVEYIHDLVKLGERVSDEEAKRMWEVWKKKELSKLPHTELVQNTREYVEIIAPGGTSLTIGSIITREELEKENKKARGRGKQPATARIWQGGKPVLIRPKLVPTEPVPTKGGELEFLPDSPEFLAYTIDDIGYREKIDSAFQEAIARAQGG
jgi:uncharacterized membrane protein (UPF0127 family)